MMQAEGRQMLSQHRSPTNTTRGRSLSARGPCLSSLREWLWFWLCRPSKWRSVCCRSNKTIKRHRFKGGFVPIMVKKHQWVSQFTSDTNHLLKLNAFSLWRIRADDRMTWPERVRASFLRSQRKSTRRASRELGDVSQWQCGGCYVSDRLSGRTSFNCWNVCTYIRGPQTVGRPLWGCCWSPVGSCLYNGHILNEIWAQDKVYKFW
jgi:hypothetical protein